MKEKLFSVYIIGSILTSIALLVVSRDDLSGNYYFMSVMFYLCTLVPGNVLFFYLIHKIGLYNIIELRPSKIIAVSSITLVLPFIIEEVGRIFFYDYLFVESIGNKGGTHDRVLWFEPLCIHFYCFIFVFVVIALRKVRKSL